MNIKDLIEEIGYSARRKAACQGGEYCSPCPFCKEGKDRFLIWPNRPNKGGEYQGGRYSCRKCGSYGDAITFLREFHGLNYRDACARLKITPKTRQFIPRLQEPAKPLIAQNPSTIWIEKATAFIEWCHANLLKNPDAFKKMQERGFTTDSIRKYKIGFNPGDRQGRDFKRSRQDWGLEERIKDDGTSQKVWLPVGFTIPTFSGGGQVVKLKIRRSAWRENDSLPKYVEISGSKPCPSIYGNTQLPVGLVLESEFDGLLSQQEVGDLLYSVALGGSTKPIDADTDALLRSTKSVLFLPDFDQAGALAWVKWKRQFPSIHRMLTPAGKSVGDAFIEGINLREWIEREIINSNKT
jgi:DNA primase